MTTTEQDRRMKVADRQALAQYYLDPRVGMPSMANDLMSPNWKAGSSDAEIVMLEILARHRQAAEARMAAAVGAGYALAMSSGKLIVALDNMEVFKHHREALLRDMKAFTDARRQAIRSQS